MDIKEKADLEEGYAYTRTQLEQLLSKLGKGGNEVVNNFLNKTNDAIEDILNQRVHLKDGRILRFRDDSNFQKVYSLFNKFIEENWEGLSDTSLTLQKAILFLNAWPRIQQEIASISKTLIALREQDTTFDLSKVRQFCDFHKVLYELIADILTEFANLANVKEKINNKIKNRLPGNSEIYGILKKMKSNAYHDLFDMFNSVLRNATSHPTTKSGLDFNETHIKFMDIHNEAIYTHEDFALAVHLWLFFASSLVILVFKKFNETSNIVSNLSKEEWADIGPKVLPIIDKLVKENSTIPTKVQ